MTIRIPTTSDPFVVTINGVKHTYKAGTMQDVPDEVASVIQNHINGVPKPTFFGNDAVERETKENYGFLAALSMGNVTMIPWRNYPNLYIEYEDGYIEWGWEASNGGDCFLDWVFPEWYDKTLGDKIKSNIVIPPTIDAIPKMYDRWGGDRRMLRIDNIWIPSTVTKILHLAFYDCYGSFLIPTSVKTIGDMVFREIENDDNYEYKDVNKYDYFPLTIDLTEFKTEPFPTLGQNEIGMTTTVKVCKGRKAELQAMTNWSQIDNILEE